MRQTRLSHQFVEFIPEQLEEGILYISRRYGTAAHKCCCGCGEEVITPLTPTDWSLQINGNVVTLHPSIGNWSFRCQSHYFIQKNRVIWAGQMSQRAIERGRANNRAAKQAYYGSPEPKRALNSSTFTNGDSSITGFSGMLYRLWSAIRRWWLS